VQIVQQCIQTHEGGDLVYVHGSAMDRRRIGTVNIMQLVKETVG